MHKKNYKKSLNYYLRKVKKFHGDSVKNESARAKQTRGGGGAKRIPIACLGLKVSNKFRLVKAL